MKKTILLAAVLFAGFSVGSFAQQYSGQDTVILNHYAARDFVAGVIPAADLEAIILAGIRAPSAVNRQPWHFTVIQNFDLSKKLVPNNVEGNVLVVVSAQGDGRTNTSQILDCALATQSIYLAAQALGYGSRIYTGPMNNLNNNLKAEVGLPSGHSAVALVRVGKVTPPVDAVSAASSRKRADDIITYKK
ncbi:MAG TPA: nitroreductase [Treponema sp.]|nr:nitroreductase [Treponema sp.]